MAETRKLHELAITPQTLIEDNKSLLATKRIEAWYAAKTEGGLTGVISCSDARVSVTTAFGTPNIVSIRTVAAGGLRDKEDPMSWVFSHKGAGKFMVLEHFDGEQFRFGECPKGCGGLGEKEKMVGQEEDLSTCGEVYDAIDYVRRHVDHHDMVLQAMITASKLTRLTNAPVLAAAIDHRTYKVFPLAELSGDNFRSSIRLADLIDYDPGKLYYMGIPTLNLAWTPGPFHSLIMANQTVVSERANNRSFFESQRVQNPRAVVISTEIRPAGARYPKTFGEPNTGFMVRLPYIKEKDGIVLSEQELCIAFAQAGYALSHAATAQQGGSFYGTDTIIIETPSMELTQRIATKLQETQAYQDWKKSRGKQLIGVQVNNAKTIEAVLFSK